MRHIARRMASEATNVQLINDSAVQPAGDWRRVSGYRLGHDGAVRSVAGLEYRRGARSLPQVIAYGTGVRIEKFPVWVESPARVFRVLRPVNTPCVAGAYRQVQHQNVPVEKVRLRSDESVMT